MKKKFLFPLAGMALLVGAALCFPPPPARADISPFQASGNLQAAATSSTCTATNTNVIGAAGACVQVQCPQGESSAVVNVANTSGITGTTTVYTAADVNGSAGVYGTPLWSTTAGGTTNVQTITNSGKLYVTLGSDQWVEAVFTTATSGHGIATVTCSGAVARVGNIAIPTSGPASFTNLVCSAPVSCSPSNGPTPAIACATCVTATPPPVLFATTGNASPSPTGTPYLQVNCGVGATGCTGAGTLTVTTGVNNSGNAEWLATVTQFGTPVGGSALTSESLSLCIVASPAPASVLDGSKFGSVQPCRDGPLTGNIAGGPSFANSTAATSGLSQTITAHVVIANSTTQTFLCYVSTTTVTAAATNTFCSVRVDPY